MQEISFHKRLRALVGEISDNAFAKKCDIPGSTMRGYLDGSSQPNLENLAKIANACGVSVGWLAAGEGEGDAIIANVAKEARLGAEYCQIPLYDVQASAGPGSYVEGEQVTDILAFRKEWVRNELHLDPAHLSLIFVHGDSMEPTLHSGDTVLIDQREGQDLADGVWALRVDGALLVKRIQKFPGGKITIKSDNAQLYPAYDLMADKLPDDLKFIGRIVWVGKRM
ncbi:MAG: helix-turn-helix domain-containing protein [Proteobacteria bacterium]|nr:helix-turn-helix domain-containing protein [Pseudomonadota bacterium]MBU1640102.1 helix-turn-helix domain-containing protein [Pseudomonadota bacterium]